MFRKNPVIVEAVTAAGLIAAPFVLPHLGFTPSTINRILVWGLFGIGFDILFGFTGLLSFGQSAFFGTGGMVAAYLLTVLNFPEVVTAVIIGMIVRAGIEDSVMVDALGIDVYKVFMLVFGIGAMAAGFAGIVNAPVVSIAPDIGEMILVQSFVVVVIGGVGSFLGAVLGGLIAGEIISITSMFNPGYAYVMLFVAMTVVLVWRPYGLLGTAGRE